jgi:6-phosphofructokinase
MWGVDMLFVVGGNGGNAGANAIQQVRQQQQQARRTAHATPLGYSYQETAALLNCSACGRILWQVVASCRMYGASLVMGISDAGLLCFRRLQLQMCEENDVLCNVIGVPKSIDNDILLIDKCFGFDTAVEEAQRALLAAKVGTATQQQVALLSTCGWCVQWFYWQQWGWMVQGSSVLKCAGFLQWVVKCWELVHVHLLAPVHAQL